MATGGRSRRELAALLGAGLLAALYFFQSSTIGPNHTDEGLILGYIDDMARGRLPFYDFVDAYGLLNWVFPVAFYKAFGMRVFGVRVWMVILKVISVAMTYVFVRPLADGSVDGADGERPGHAGAFYGALASLWMAILLGAQWQSLQTAYAFITVIPLVLGAWHVILSAPFATRRKNAVVAGLLTAAAVWTKLNTGMFLAAGGLYAYFFWVGAERRTGGEAPAVGAPGDAALELWMRRLVPLGIAAYALLFAFFMRRHFNEWFALYLLLPLVIASVWSFFVLRRGSYLPARLHVEPFVAFLVTSLGLSFLFLVGYYGTHIVQYAREISGILGAIHYTAPFPKLGKPGPYVGLNEYYWLQLPWLLTLLFALFVSLSWKFGPRAFGEGFARRRAQVSALFVLVTLHSFAMYARSDETHIYQAIVLVVPALFVVLAQLDAFLRATKPDVWAWMRVIVATFVVWFSHTLFVVPEARAFALGPGEWHNPKLEHLRYRDEQGRYVRDFSPHLSDHDWDVIEDDAALYVKGITEPDEEVLLLTANRLMYLNSGARPVGGRYHFFFYLVSVGLLDREGFDRLVPKEVVEDIVTRPPRVIVAAFGFVPLALQFPEFAKMRDERYARTKTFRHIWIYELRSKTGRVETPLR